jgi:hypothetical protein
MKGILSDTNIIRSITRTFFIFLLFILLIGIVTILPIGFTLPHCSRSDCWLGSGSSSSILGFPLIVGEGSGCSGVNLFLRYYV